ncbi:hypothetical protein DN752_00470 [Echinicola strongylocentroti]|uniref:Uncharacterized protein n=1 Tax=Echinicola strongylocentroti TaxID=1795355 RepID=A0A2Z4ID33_9BACT|nr:hypothetical protein [Echinicola strongylocentroti]AWW28730.1 hypothetical protein DN752_00470 [Echinicola strongylocentroti]
MQHTWKFNLSSKKDEDVTKWVSECLVDQQKELEIFLSFYTKSEGAVAENTTIEKVIFQDTNVDGKITVAFHKVFYNACLNIHETDKDHMQLTFKIDQDNETLQVSGPIVEERGMDEI